MDGKRKGFLVALAIGLVSAPALALVASGLLGGQAKAGEPVATTAAVAVETSALNAVSTTTGGDIAAADLEAACTTEGAGLVAREAAGVLSDLQQAALDALRPICESEGFSLEATPAAAIAAPLATTSAPAVTTTTPIAQFDDDGDEGEYEYEGEDEGEYEDEGGSQSQYEDHEDESDESDEYEDEG